MPQRGPSELGDGGGRVVPPVSPVADAAQYVEPRGGHDYVGAVRNAARAAPRGSTASISELKSRRSLGCVVQNMGAALPS